MTTYELKAAKRTILGKKVKSLRKGGVVPGNVFGKKTPSVAVQMDHKALVATLRLAGETSLVHLKIDGETKVRPVLVAGYAQNPVSGELLHVDFHEVDLTQKTTAMVPVKAVGESEAVKSGNILVLQRNEIEVEALPTDLPDVIEIDISILTEVGASIHAKDLKVDRSKVTLIIEDEEVVATIQEPAKEEVVEAAPAEGEAAEGAEKAEGDAKAEEAKSEEKKD
jgi:large subunit ribosomal protein L25